MRVICGRDLRWFTSLNLVVKRQAERAGPLGQRREDGSPLGPTPGETPGIGSRQPSPIRGHVQGHDYIKQFQAGLKLPSGSHLRCQSDATRVRDFFQAR